MVFKESAEHPLYVSWYISLAIKSHGTRDESTFLHRDCKKGITGVDEGSLVFSCFSDTEGEGNISVFAETRGGDGMGDGGSLVSP